MPPDGDLKTLLYSPAAYARSGQKYDRFTQLLWRRMLNKGWGPGKGGRVLGIEGLETEGYDEEDTTTPPSLLSADWILAAGSQQIRRSQKLEAAALHLQTVRKLVFSDASKHSSKNSDDSARTQNSQKDSFLLDLFLKTCAAQSSATSPSAVVQKLDLLRRFLSPYFIRFGSFGFDYVGGSSEAEAQAAERKSPVPVREDSFFQRHSETVGKGNVGKTGKSDRESELEKEIRRIVEGGMEGGLAAAAFPLETYSRKRKIRDKNEKTTAENNPSPEPKVRLLIGVDHPKVLSSYFWKSVSMWKCFAKQQNYELVIDYSLDPNLRELELRVAQRVAQQEGAGRAWDTTTNKVLGISGLADYSRYYRMKQHLLDRRCHSGDVLFGGESVGQMVEILGSLQGEKNFSSNSSIEVPVKKDPQKFFWDPRKSLAENLPKEEIVHRLLQHKYGQNVCVQEVQNQGQNPNSKLHNTAPDVLICIEPDMLPNPSCSASNLGRLAEMVRRYF